MTRGEQKETVDVVGVLSKGRPGYATSAFRADSTGRTFTPACPKCHRGVASKRVWVRAPQVQLSRSMNIDCFESVVWCHTCAQFTGLRIVKDQEGTMVSGAFGEVRNPPLLTGQGAIAKLKYYVRRMGCILERKEQ